MTSGLSLEPSGWITSYTTRPTNLNYGIGGNELSWKGEVDEFIRAVRKNKVHQIMNDNILSGPLNEPVISILGRLVKNHLRRISAVDHGKLVGVVYMSDIFYHLFSE